MRSLTLLLLAGVSLSGFSCSGPQNKSGNCCTPLSEAEFHFTAKGFEPGWILTINPDKVFFVDNYGEDTLSQTQGTLIRLGERIILITTSKDPSKELFITITKKPVPDPAGKLHPYTIRIEKGAETRTGWGNME